MTSVVDLGEAKRRKGANGAGAPPVDDGRPVIRMKGGELPEVVDLAEAALSHLSGDRSVFVRGGRLVRPVDEKAPGDKGRLVSVTRLKALGPEALTDLLAQAATFQRFDPKRGTWITIDPPPKVAATLLSREGRWTLPVIAGVITTPTLRPDGSLLATPGYDPATRLHLSLDADFRLAAIPEVPTRADAERARDKLLGVLEEFPFVGPVDRAVALSGVLTTVLRPTLPTAPAHVMRAHTAGTGKSYLVDLFAAIATGRFCPVMAAGRSEEETEKRLGAMLLSAVPVISLDNVNGELGGDVLCQMSERPLVRVRILGQSDAPEIECRATIFATGNNLTLVGDMTRRAVLCNLDAGIEQPELREFAFDPIARVLADRGAFVAAALTIVRAYRAAGAPRMCGPLGSYGPWSDTVRSALVWLGEADPVSSMDVVRKEDPQLAAVRELFARWREDLLVGSAYTSSVLKGLVDERDPSGELIRPDFRELLMRQANDGREVSTKRLGKWLSAIQGRVVEGYRLDMKVSSSHGNRFTLHAADSG